MFYGINAVRTRLSQKNRLLLVQIEIFEGVTIRADGPKWKRRMIRVLLADDEEALRLLMSRQLRRAGYEVTVVEDGQAAAELLEKETFNVIVSDMKMPRLDGMGLLEIATRIAPTTEFIILTGHGNMENAVHAFKTGNVFDYLLKPLNDIRELDAVVERAARAAAPAVGKLAHGAGTGTAGRKSPPDCRTGKACRANWKRRGKKWPTLPSGTA